MFVVDVKIIKDYKNKTLLEKFNMDRGGINYFGRIRAGGLGILH
jgi:hypothetical protein